MRELEQLLYDMSFYEFQEFPSTSHYLATLASNASLIRLVVAQN